MNRKNVLSLTACFLVLFLGFALHDNIGVYINLSGFLIVVGGSCGAALVSYRYDRLKVVAQVVAASYRNRPKDPREIVDLLVKLAVKTRFEGVLPLHEDEEKESILFLRSGIGLLVDGYSGQEIRSLLTEEMAFFRQRRNACEQVLRNVADFFPAFGLVGSVVGLVGMLSGVGDTRVILATVPVALTSTLYGIVFSNLFFLPFAANLREHTNRELLLQKIIIEGIIAIESGMNPRVLERKLKSFLTPSSRRGKIIPLRKRPDNSQIGFSPRPASSISSAKRARA